jgi:hypothetical protein
MIDSSQIGAQPAIAIRQHGPQVRRNPKVGCFTLDLSFPHMNLCSAPVLFGLVLL